MMPSKKGKMLIRNTVPNSDRMNLLMQCYLCRRKRLEHTKSVFDWKLRKSLRFVIYKGSPADPWTASWIIDNNLIKKGYANKSSFKINTFNFSYLFHVFQLWYLNAKINWFSEKWGVNESLTTLTEYNCFLSV